MTLSDQLRDLLTSFGGFGPVAWLSVAFAGLMVAELLLRRVADGRAWLTGLTLAVVIGAGVWAILVPQRGFLFLHLLFLDDQAIFYQLILVVSTALVLLYEASPKSERIARQRFGERRSDASESELIIKTLPAEWFALTIALLIGAFVLTMAVNLLVLYLSLELISICSYLLTALSADRRGSEGGLKYMLFGAVSSAVMLYGMSLLYGMTGTLDITAPAFGLGLTQNEPAVVLVAGLLALAGLLFKLSAVPFHFWTPDAYEAAPVPVAALLSVVPKAAALLALIRFVSALSGNGLTDGGPTSGIGLSQLADIQVPLAVLALAGILLGNLSALRQTDAKRLLAYSTIAQAGFLLVGVVALNQAGLQGATFYMATYLFMTLPAFFLIEQLARANGGSFALADFAGLGPRQPLLAISLTVVMLSLVGLPPTVGFTAKLLVFTALFDAWQTSGNGWLLALFVAGLLNAVVSLVYYLRIPYLLFFRPAVSEITEPIPALSNRWAMVLWLLPALTGLVNLLLFGRPGWLLAWISGL
jgi:NADH-quinone oxidoreductase subunit N